MKTLFESILNNHIILFETKVNAKRHFTNEEAKEIVDIVKQSIDDGTLFGTRAIHEINNNCKDIID